MEPGARLGPYKVEAPTPLRAGFAWDPELVAGTHLGRDVANDVLPAEHAPGRGRERPAELRDDGPDAYCFAGCFTRVR